MSSTITKVLSSPYLLFSTSIFSFIFAHVITHRVRKNGPLRFASTFIKYNSIFYSIASLLLCLAIAHSIWTDISQTSHHSHQSIICSSSRSESDVNLRYLFHASKVYEYIDIFNVLAVGGIVNTHFWFHHFTTPYLTYVRVLSYPTGWKVFAFLNTLHHAFMYAYFGGAAIFSEVLPVTGYLQLGVGILGELYVVWMGCGGEVWANGVAVVLLACYAVLFWGDLKKRGKKTEVDEKTM